MMQKAVMCLSAGVLSMCASGTCRAGAPAYELVGSFQTPTGSGARAMTADGRLVVMVGNEIHLQSAASASSFAQLGSIDAGLLNAFGASCIAISPDGGSLAIGDGNFGPGAQVHFIDWSGLDPNTPTTVTSVDAASYEAHWAQDGRLYLSGADFSDTIVSVIDGVDRGAPVVTRLIEGVGGASGGVTVRDGTLFTSNGFDFDDSAGSITGDVRAFELDTLSRGAANFETDGTLVASALSGLSLGFDGLGNMLIGGGDFGNPSQFGFGSIVSGDAILAAISGLGAATDANEQWLSPAGANTYSLIYDAWTQEILVWGFADDVVYRYAVPSPAGIAVIAGFAALSGRRRRA